MDKIFGQAIAGASCFEGARIGRDMPKQTLHQGRISGLSFHRMNGLHLLLYIRGMDGDDEYDADAKNDSFSMGNSIRMVSPTSSHQYQSHMECSQKCRIHLWLLTYVEQSYSQKQIPPTQIHPRFS